MCRALHFAEKECTSRESQNNIYMYLIFNSAMYASLYGNKYHIIVHNFIAIFNIFDRYTKNVSGITFSQNCLC